MVRKVFSFLALFRKVSWMFCASFSMDVLGPVSDTEYPFLHAAAPMVTVHHSASAGANRASSAPHASLGCGGPGLRHQFLHVRQQPGSVVGNAVFDGPFHSPGVDRLAAADLIHAGGIKH